MLELYTLFIRRPFIFKYIKYRPQKNTMTSQFHTLMYSDLLILGAVHAEIQYEQTFVWAWADSVKIRYPGKIQTQDQPEFFWNLQSFVDCSMETSDPYNFFD